MATYKKTKGAKPPKVNIKIDKLQLLPTYLRLEEKQFLPESFDQAMQDHL